MIDISADRELITAAYARGGRREAVDTFLDLLSDLEQEWSDERIKETTVFVRDLLRSEDRMVES